MALVCMKDLLAQAERNGFGIGAFNVGNMEMIMGVIRAAEEMNAPVIMQIAEGRLAASPLHIIGPAMVAAAEVSSAEIAVHLDHGKTAGTIRQALDIGFTSVMFDGSALPYVENVRKTREITELAKEYGAAVECEIGVVGGNEGDGEHRMQYSDPEEAGRFSRESGSDAMAVAIGNAHGVYKAEPKLRFDILEKIRAGSSLPLVLHGGSGISDAGFQKAIRCGIRKVNIATASFMRTVDQVGNYFDEKGSSGLNYFDMSEAMVQGTYENVKHHIQVFSLGDLGDH